MNQRILTAILAALTFMLASAQTADYDKRINLGNGLYKVESHGRWGIVDTRDNLLLSVEYNEPVFVNGKAVITLYGTDQLAGIVSAAGIFKQLPPYYISRAFPHVYENMLVVRSIPTGKWGYLNTNTVELLKVQIGGSKTNNALAHMGIVGSNKGIKGTFLFDFAAPFVEGMAVVYTTKTGWHHIDTAGKERLKSKKGTPTLFRTSLHNGKCVIFGDQGIVVCKETPDQYAGVVKYLADYYDIKDYSTGLTEPFVITTGKNRLYLNPLFKADKFENTATKDSVILIERPKPAPAPAPAVQKPKDSFNLQRDIEIKLAKTNISASSKGTATVTLNITNSGKFDSDLLHLTMTGVGRVEEWEGIIPAGQTQQVSISVPAKFSAANINPLVVWTLKDTNNEITGRGYVTIYRYRPKRR